MMPQSPTKPLILGLVLAGGMSRRMQSARADAQALSINNADPAETVRDKALMPCAGKPLIAWTLEALRPQVRQLLINCNQYFDDYARLGFTLISDRIEGYLGPLAGIHAALHWLHADPDRLSAATWLLVAPCDCPFLPEDFAACMLSAADESVEVVVAADSFREQPAFLLIRPQLMQALEAFLLAGGRKLDAWYRTRLWRLCTFVDHLAFRNVNTPADLTEAESLLLSPCLDAEGLMADIGSLQRFAPGSTLHKPGTATGQRQDNLPIDELRERLLHRIRPLRRYQSLGLTALEGQVLAKKLTAQHDVPAFQNAAMDGFALRFKDLKPESETSLIMGERITAGHPARHTPSDEPQALTIMTGGVLPEGFDLVVPQEACQIKSDRVLIPAGQQQGQHVRMPGEDLACGDVVVEAGIRLNAIHIGLMASLGLAAASVRGPLRVALLSTGDELLDPTQPGAQAQGKRFDSNRFLLRALLVKWPSIALHDVGIVADQPQSLEQILCALGEEHDLILSSGGVSAGEADFTRGIMERLGQLAFCKVAMRPGRPLAMGRLGRALYLGLPGNPVAAAMTFWYFVAPVIERLLGLTPKPWALKTARAAHRIEKKAGRSEFQRASIAVDAESTVWLSVNPNQGSGILSSLSKSSVIAVLEHDRSTIEAGDSLRYVCIDDLL
ncbi:MAG: hypothetical protein EBX62_03460 [Betaproteobacteria bacterium]|nr:hypothetical protein [Betaproteobacteria bacterium]